MGLRTGLCISLVSAMFLAGCGGGGSAAAPAASAAATLSAWPNPGQVAPDGMLTIDPSGGTPPYSFTLSGSGSLSASSGYYTTYTAPASDGSAQVEIVDSAGNVLYYDITISGSSTGGGVITITPSDTTVAMSSTTSISASGGTAPYTFIVISGSGYFASPSSGVTSASFVAPNDDETDTIEVTDSAGNTEETYIYVGTSGTTSSEISCEGNYAINDAGTTGSLTLYSDSSGNVGGILYEQVNGYSYYYPVTGTCSVSGSVGSFNLSNPALSETYTGSVVYNTELSLQGSVTGTPYSFTGTSQSAAGSMPAAAQTCEGTYTASVAGYNGSMVVVSDSSGNFAGYFALVVPYQGTNYTYYYALGGTCSITSGQISFTDYTTQATYTGSVGIVGGASIIMGGTNNLGSSWSATQ